MTGTHLSSEVIKLATNALNQSTDWNIQIAIERQKYSNWFLGIATAGIAVIATQETKIVANSLVGEEISSILLRVSIVMNVISIVIGMSAYWYNNILLERNRQIMTCYIRQEISMLAGEFDSAIEREENVEGMGVKMAACDYTEKYEKEKYMKWEEGRSLSQRRSKKFYKQQIILCGASYLVFIIASF